eukprot:TRINITY_DN20698_c0_g1_i1.p2 TRINITY_DN20698_c0_g1~~TRINITY_DN20698_c0_g1_i1.p2  ORF type:complete len:226 (+),score=75.04 TRINITY_DN20698_c0_g1_i1:52-678(+)
MADYTMIYWPGFTGRAEPILMVLAEAGKTFDLEPDVKGFIAGHKGFPVFACPVVRRNADQVCVSQTTAILQWLGEELGLGGGDGINRTRAMQTALNVADIWSEAYNGRKGEDAGAAFLSARLPKWLAVLEASLASAGSGFFTAQLSYADFAAYNVLRVLEFMFGEQASSAIKANDKLSAHYAAMAQRPAMVSYLSSALPVLYDGVKSA